MTKQQIAKAVANLDALPGKDPEADHWNADAIVLDCVPQAVREAYERVQERNWGWWYS